MSWEYLPSGQCNKRLSQRSYCRADSVAGTDLHMNACVQWDRWIYLKELCYATLCGAVSLRRSNTKLLRNVLSQSIPSTDNSLGNEIFGSLRSIEIDIVMWSHNRKEITLFTRTNWINWTLLSIMFNVIYKNKPSAWHIVLSVADRHTAFYAFCVDLLFVFDMHMHWSVTSSLCVESSCVEKSSTEGVASCHWTAIAQIT